MLKLAELLTDSDNSHQNEIGYLVRKWRDTRLSPWDRSKARKKIDQLEAQLAERAKEKRRVLEELKAKAVQRAGYGEVTSAKDHAHLEDGEDCVPPMSHHIHPEAVQEAQSGDTHSPTPTGPSRAEPRPPDTILKHWPFYDDVFMVSGLKGDGIEKLKVSVSDQHQW